MPKSNGPYCGGKLRHRDGTCERAAGAGTDHLGAGRCSWHGGCSPSGRVAGAEQKARAEIARLDLPPTSDPIGELAKLTAQVIAWKDAMAEQVNSLTSLRYESFSEDGAGGEQLRAEVALWERALDRCERFLTAMARLNIEERMARVTEKQAAMAAEALQAVLGEIGLDDDQRRDAQARLGRHLRAVS